MTKSLFISSSLLLAAGCTTAGDTSSEEALHHDAASSKSLLSDGIVFHPIIELPELGDPEEESEPEEALTEEEIIDGMVDAVLTFTVREKQDAVLAMRSYAMPLGPESGEELPPIDCGVAPSFDSLQVLDSDCAALDRRWGWEVAVENCQVGGQEFSGVMQVTYTELQEYNEWFPKDNVEEAALAALELNGQGVASLRYALNVTSPLSEVASCGEEFGPMSFRVSERDTIRWSSEDESAERVTVQGMQHEMAAGSAASGQILSNRDGQLEVMVQDGEPVLASFLTVGVVAQQGDLWPTQGSIEAHVEKQGVVRLNFTPQTAIDGTVEIDTPLGIQLATLPMD